MLSDIERLGQADSRVADLMETATVSASEGITWLSDHCRDVHPDGRMETGDLMTLAMSGFMAGFMVAARLGHDDPPSLSELYTLLTGGVPALQALDNPELVSELLRSTRRGKRADA